MADASQSVIINFPAGNGAVNLLTYTLNLGPCNVRRILLTWPAGCAGQLFLSVHAGNGYAFPSMPNQYLAFDDYTYVFDVTNQIDSGQWSIVGYNSDYIDHDPIVVFEYDYLRGNQAAPSTTPVAL